MFDTERKCQLESLYPRLDSNAEKYGTNQELLNRAGTLVHEFLRDIFMKLPTQEGNIR